MEPDIARQFERSWKASASQARSRRGWRDMTLEEKKAHSSQFRRAMKKYGLKQPDGAQMDVEAFAWPESSKEVG